MEPINQLEPADQDALIAEARLLTFATDETVFNEGSNDDFANYLLQGSVEFLWNNRPVKLIDARDKAAIQALDLSGKNVLLRERGVIASFSKSSARSSSRSCIGSR